MNKILWILIIMSNQIAFGQNLAERLNNNHEKYKENSLKTRLFKHKDIVAIIDKMKKEGNFEIKEVAKSTQKREIFQVKIGHGKTSVLLWSQMHGDEPTATMAMFDLFNFFSQKDEFDELRKNILENCTLYFVPMLNPDGAEVWKRRTALDIDMNRDALRLQTPEGRLLKSLQNNLKPVFGFNLHDQAPRYSVGETGNQTAISFLATAYDHERNVNQVRKQSMQLIVNMNKTLQKFIPNKVGRYSDEHEPRAFGDNIQKWGTSLILIESGGYKNDPKKMYLRKMNFLAILTGLNSIADESYQKEEISNYNLIPENGQAIYDLIIKNVWVQKQGQKVKMDLAINRLEEVDSTFTKFVTKGIIEELGDLSIFHGIEEINAEGMEVVSKEELKYKGKAEFEIFDKGTGKYRIKNGQLIKQ